MGSLDDDGVGPVSRLRRSGALAGRLARDRGVQHVHVALSLQEHPRSTYDMSYDILARE